MRLSIYCYIWGLLLLLLVDRTAAAVEHVRMLGQDRAQVGPVLRGEDPVGRRDLPLLVGRAALTRTELRLFDHGGGLLIDDEL